MRSFFLQHCRRKCRKKANAHLTKGMRPQPVQETVLLVRLTTVIGMVVGIMAMTMFMAVSLVEINAAGAWINGKYFHLADGCDIILVVAHFNLPDR